MDRAEIIEGLQDLIRDRESFFHTPPDEDDEVFRHDAAVLKAAIAIIEGK